MAGTWTLEIVVPITDDLPCETEFADLTGVEMALMETGSKRGAELVASEVGGGEARIVFECGRWRKFAGDAVRIFADAGHRPESVSFELNAEGLDEIFRFGGADPVATLPFPDAPPRRQACTVHDYFAIPLGDGRWGHCYFHARLKGLGDVVRVLDLFTQGRPATLEQARAAATAFWPLMISVKEGFDYHLWRRVGREESVASAALPEMRYSAEAEACRFKPGTYSDWKIVDPASGLKAARFVGGLSGEQPRLEVWRTWPGYELRERLRKGTHPVLFAV